jgi:F0F1-type ATP synthase assembly protein I
MPEEPVKQPRKKSGIVVAGEYSALAFILPSSIIAGWLIGAWLDKMFGTTYLYMVFLLLGIVGGFINIFRFLNRKNG